MVVIGEVNKTVLGGLRVKVRQLTRIDIIQLPLIIGRTQLNS